MYKVVLLFFVGFRVPFVSSVQIDFIDCGIDHEVNVAEGSVKITQYPWLGILYYKYHGDNDESRAITTVALIQREFVIASAADVGPMPKHDFRRNTRVLLGEDWRGVGRRVRNYVIHPEYDETYNTVALVQLKDPVRTVTIKPLCPPPEILRDPEFYVVKFKDEYNVLEKQVIPVTHVPASLCQEFYIRANHLALMRIGGGVSGHQYHLFKLITEGKIEGKRTPVEEKIMVGLYAKRLRPPHVTCAVSLDDEMPCVWEAGAALVARDVWGRWQLLGLGVRGPGCGAPSRYLDVMSYFPWVQESLSKFRQLTISKITKQSYVLRSSNTYQRFGACDPEEKINLVYRELIVLRTNNNQYQFITYNMTLRDNVEYSCLTLELVNASAVSEMRIKHECRRSSYGPPCYMYRGSIFEISVYMMFSEKCTFEMYAWGWKKNMTLLDIHEWKWEEGTYYEDFNIQPVEYRGPMHETEFGFEPLDRKMWVPEFDIWTTTEFDNSTWSSTTPPPSKYVEGPIGRRSIGERDPYRFKNT